MTLADLRAIVEAMTDPAPWMQGNFERYNMFVHDGEALGGPVLGERVLLKANTYFPYVENIAAIAALRNHADALLDLVTAADAVLAESDPGSEAPAVRELRAARGRLEVIE